MSALAPLFGEKRASSASNPTVPTVSTRARSRPRPSSHRAQQSEASGRGSAASQWGDLVLRTLVTGTRPNCGGQSSFSSLDVRLVRYFESHSDLPASTRGATEEALKSVERHVL